MAELGAALPQQPVLGEAELNKFLDDWHLHHVGLKTTENRRACKVLKALETNPDIISPALRWRERR